MKMVTFGDINGAEYVFPEDSIQGMQTKMNEKGFPTDTFIVKVHDGGEKLIEVDKATFENLAEFYTKEYNEYWEHQTEKLAIALAEDEDDDATELKKQLEQWTQKQYQPYGGNFVGYHTSSGSGTSLPHTYTSSGSSSSALSSSSSSTLGGAQRARQAANAMQQKYRDSLAVQQAAQSGVMSKKTAGTLLNELAMQKGGDDD